MQEKKIKAHKNLIYLQLHLKNLANHQSLWCINAYFQFSFYFNTKTHTNSI